MILADRTVPVSTGMIEYLNVTAFRTSYYLYMLPFTLKHKLPVEYKSRAPRSIFTVLQE